MACVFAHATGLCAGAWRPVLSAVKPSAQVLAFDFRGHGTKGQDVLSEGYTWDVVAATMNFKKNIGNAPIIGIGHSFGGASILKVIALIVAYSHYVCMLATFFLLLFYLI
jgi:pimeloyl-ACP methyl ester carboxylesterase